MTYEFKMNLEGTSKLLAKFSVAAIALTFISTNLACKRATAPDNTARLKFISGTEFDCNLADSGNSGVQLLDKAPSNFFANWDSGELTKVKGQMASLPDQYLKHLFEANSQAGFQVIQTQLDPGTAGLTMLGYYSQWAKIAPGQVERALLHELGHALHYYVDDQSGGKFGSALSSIFSSSERTTSGVAGYPQSGEYEWFAEAFHNYYCSKDAQDWINQNLPKTAAMFKENLLAARWADPNGGNTGTGTGTGTGTTPDTNTTPNSNTTSNTNDQLASNFSFYTYPATGYAGAMSFIAVTAPADVIQVEFCMGDKAYCLASQGVQGSVKYIKATEVGQLPNQNPLDIGRRRFVSTEPYPLMNQGEKVTIAGKKAGFAAPGQANVVFYETTVRPFMTSSPNTVAFQKAKKK